MKKYLLLAACTTLCIGCTPTSKESAVQKAKESEALASSNTMRPEVRMTLRSDAFADWGTIPSEYTCDGEGKMPKLTIWDAPKETAAFALIVQDPDAPSGTFLHYAVWNLGSGTTVIDEKSIASGKEARNDAKKTSFVGPCPPTGTHRYTFDLYALHTPITTNDSMERVSLEKTIAEKSLAVARLTGLYSRRQKQK